MVGNSINFENIHTILQINENISLEMKPQFLYTHYSDKLIAITLDKNIFIGITNED